MRANGPIYFPTKKAMDIKLINEVADVREFGIEAVT